MSELISAELAATCASLGYWDGITYHLDSHCLDVLKDLIKYLKRDDDSHTVRKYLGRAKLLEVDLKKIFIQTSDKIELWDVLLRLLINLTSPALMVYNEELPSEKTSRNMYEQLVDYLQAYKVSLADDRVWSVVGKRLQNIINMDPLERGEDNEMVVERILTLIRNVLQVPANDNEKRADNDATVHDEVLFALHTSGLVDMLLFITSNSGEQQYHMQVLEIVALMLGEQCPSKLAKVGLERSDAEKERDNAVLLANREKETRERMEKMKKYAGSRHSRFGGTFVVQNMKAIGENQLICHKPYQKIEALEFGKDKVTVKKSKKKMPVIESKGERTSALSVRLFLKEFCIEFLNGAYNPVMRYARSCINGGGGDHGGIASDGTYYLWSLRFFMEFNRNYRFQIKYVSETISTETFHLVQRQLEQYYEMMMTDKKKIPLWSRRLHLAVRAYQELLHSLSAMDNSRDEDVRESSKIIKSNVFYVPEYRETILAQLQRYDDVKMSRTYLIDLVTTAHIFLKMLRHFCDKNRTVIVGKKKTKRGKKVGKKGKSLKEAPRETTSTKSLDDMWDDVAPEISAVMKEGTITSVVPFDATLETSVDEQKDDAMKKIQISLRKRNFEYAIGLLRSSREVWPENDCFGKSDISEEEEFLALREIFFAKLGADIDYQDQSDGFVREETDFNVDNENEEDEDDEEEEASRETEIAETNFMFKEFIRRFANVKIVKALTILLGLFDQNTDLVNHYVLKMLHSIAWECELPGMMFQASIFRIFQRILDSKSSRHKDLAKFAVFIIRQFAKAAQINPKAYMELWFWKTTAEAMDVVNGYDNPENDNTTSRGTWTEAEEDELRTLFMEHETNKHSKDLIDWILENMISEKRTRRGVIKKLKELCLVRNSKATKSQVQKRLPKEWSEEEIIELTEVWHRVKDDQDPVGTIYDALTIKRPVKAIKDKLLEIGLAMDMKELRKKRRKDGNLEGKKSSWETKSASDDDSDDDEESSIPKKATAPKKRRPRSSKQPAIIYSDDQLIGLVKDVIDRDMTSGLEWLRESLQEIIDEDDEENIEGIPLVPFTEDTIVAMESPNFQRLLKAFGIEPPADEQETYWRVPPSMLPATIRRRCTLIQDTLSGKIVVEAPSANAQESDDLADSTDEVERIPSPEASDSDVPAIRKRSRPIKSALSKKIVDDAPSAQDFDDLADSADEGKRMSSLEDSDSDAPVLKKRRIIISDDED